MNLLLIRHAESVANAQGIYQGQTFDTGLSDLGQKQAKVLAKFLGSNLIDKIVCSPARRCRQTVELLSKVASTRVEEEPLLWEINHGQWEGKPKEEVEQLFSGELKTWRGKPSEVIMPEGESLVDVSSRVQKWFQKVDQFNGEAKNNLVVVTHDTIIRTILIKLLRRELDDIWMFDLDNAGITTIEWGQFPQVAAINQTEYLGELKSELEKQAL